MSRLSGAQHEASPRAETPPRGIRPDIALLRKAQAGDRAAYGQLVLMYQDRLYNAVLRLVGDHDEAMELTQEAFTRGLTSLDSFRGDSAPYTWLFRIAVNLAISQLRKVQKQRFFSLDRPGPSGATRSHGEDQAQCWSIVWPEMGPPPPSGPSSASVMRQFSRRWAGSMRNIERCW